MRGSVSEFLSWSVVEFITNYPDFLAPNDPEIFSFGGSFPESVSFGQTIRSFVKNILSCNSVYPLFGSLKRVFTRFFSGSCIFSL